MKKSIAGNIGEQGRQKRKTSICFLSLLLLSFAHGFCQKPELNTIKTSFEEYSRQGLSEKIFLHTDKSFYVAGEIVWFKIYDVDGSLNKPLDLSKVAYIEILNKELKPVLQAKVSIRDGAGSGSFFLPLSVNSGAYKIRAYTNWMKNFNAGYYFEKNLTIVNPLKKLGQVSAANTQAYDIRFFPEGGNLVSGIQSKVAFRVTDEAGKGIDCKGSIVDQDNNSVVNFESLKFGIGHFLFTPSAANKYKAVIKSGNNNVMIAELPAIYDHGYTLQVEDMDNERLKVTVKTNNDAGGRFVYLFAHTRQVVKAAEMLVINNGNASFIINKNALGDGISHFTLFDSDKQPVCERLYFKRPAQQLTVNLKTEFEEYKSRKKVYVDIFARDEKDKPAMADMSMSVFLADSLQVTDEGDIYSYLWLNSDLKGNVESPGYYFKNSGALVDEALDNLMLTHGWRRFRWEDITSHTPFSFEFVPEYEGHIITGKLTDKRSGLPVENVPAYLSVPGEHFQLGGSVSNNKGKIQFDIKKFYGSPEVIIEAGNKQDTIYRVDISNPFSEKFSESLFPAFDFPESLQEQLISHSIYTQVQNTYQTDNLQRFDAPPEMSDSTAFYGQPDRKYFLDDYTRFVTMEEVMREYVTGISLRKQQGKFHIQVMDDSWHNFFNDDPLVLLDGAPVFDIDKIIAFDPFKVKKNRTHEPAIHFRANSCRWRGKLHYLQRRSGRVPVRSQCSDPGI